MKRNGFLQRNGLSVDHRMADFIEARALPGTGLAAAAFWSGFAALIHDLAPKNRALLATRDALQAQIDAWHRANRGASIAAQKAFLEEIGYLLPEGPDFKIATTNIDPEIATVAGPQPGPAPAAGRHLGLRLLTSVTPPPAALALGVAAVAG